MLRKRGEREVRDGGLTCARADTALCHSLHIQCQSGVSVSNDSAGHGNCGFRRRRPRVGRLEETNRGGKWRASLQSRGNAGVPMVPESRGEHRPADGEEGVESTYFGDQPHGQAAHVESPPIARMPFTIQEVAADAQASSS